MSIKTLNDKKKYRNTVVRLIKLLPTGSVHLEKENSENSEKERNMNACKLHVVYSCFKKIPYVDTT